MKVKWVSGYLLPLYLIDHFDRIALHHFYEAAIEAGLIAKSQSGGWLCLSADTSVGHIKLIWGGGLGGNNRATTQKLSSIVSLQ